MLKTKLNYFLIFLFLLNSFIYSQTKDYKQLYSDLTRDVKSNQEFQERTSQFFNSMDNKELPLAIANISKERDVNFIAYELFAQNSIRFKNKEFRYNLIKQLKVKSNSSDFKIVLIDFMSSYDRKEEKELENLNNALFEIAKNKELHDDLRSYATLHLGNNKNYEINKKQLSELLKTNNYAIINSASNVIESIIRNGISENEKKYWTTELVNQIDRNSDNLIELKGVISSLGNIDSEIAKNRLLIHFNNNVSSDMEVSELIAYALVNNASLKTINSIFSSYHRNSHFNNFGSTLLLERLANNNNAKVNKLLLSNKNESTLNYIRAVKHLKLSEKVKHSNKVISLLKNKSQKIRLEAIKTLHFILPYEEEVKIFNDHVKSEDDEEIKNEIYFYVGEG